MGEMGFLPKENSRGESVNYWLEFMEVCSDVLKVDGDE